MKRIREKYVTNPFFDPNFVKKVSTACEGLCKWVRAIEVYDRVIKIVSPKKAKLAEAEQELARQMDKLNEKRAQLQQVRRLFYECKASFVYFINNETRI